MFWWGASPVDQCLLWLDLQHVSAKHGIEAHAYVPLLGRWRQKTPGACCRAASAVEDSGSKIRLWAVNPVSKDLASTQTHADVHIHKQLHTQYTHTNTPTSVSLYFVSHFLSRRVTKPLKWVSWALSFFFPRSAFHASAILRKVCTPDF